MSENRRLFRIRNQENNGFRRVYYDTYTYVNPESYDESLTQTTIPIVEISQKIFDFIVKIVKDPEYIYDIIPSTSYNIEISMKQRHRSISILIMWFLLIMKRFSRYNDYIPQYIGLFDQFEQTIGAHIMNTEWYDNNLIHQHIVKYLLQQWFHVKLSI